MLIRGCSVLTILIPTAFFAALDNGVTADGLVSDETRSMFLQMSHGLAVILLLVYIMSRIFLHNPPGDGNALQPAPGAPVEIHLEEARLLEERPKVTSGFCLLLLLATIAVLAVTAEMLVESIEHVREDGNIQEEWFGLILLPIVSFSADGVVAILYFVRAALFLAPEPPATLAKARAIDLSVQFTLFWMPFLVLLGWWLGKPLILLFGMGPNIYRQFALNFFLIILSSFSRPLRSGGHPRRDFLGQLRHSGLEDELGGGIHPRSVLLHDCAWNEVFFLEVWNMFIDAFLSLRCAVRAGIMHVVLWGTDDCRRNVVLREHSGGFGNGSSRRRRRIIACFFYRMPRFL